LTRLLGNLAISYNATQTIGQEMRFCKRPCELNELVMEKQGDFRID
jgi:hypothetical protein